jgi:2-polyprenyl-3-methyl-5-hydroxy-6-metoxy-1,4-benzoquinol methylase
MMKKFELPNLRVPTDMLPGDMPDLLRYWYLGSRARRHMMLKRFSQVDVEIADEGIDPILDIGSAWGFNVMALSTLGKRVVGIDLVEAQFAAGRRVAEASGLHLDVAGADASCLPFGDGRFAGITMVETFEHIFEADRGKTAAECHRILRRGGRVVISTPNYGSLVERVKRVIVRLPWLKRRLPTMCYPTENVSRGEYHPYRYHHPVPPEKIAGLLEDHGFKVLKTKYFLFVLKNSADWSYPLMAFLERLAERTPGIRRLAATVCIVAERT